MSAQSLRKLINLVFIAPSSHSDQIVERFIKTFEIRLTILHQILVCFATITANFKGSLQFLLLLLQLITRRLQNAQLLVEIFERIIVEMKSI